MTIYIFGGKGGGFIFDFHACHPHTTTHPSCMNQTFPRSNRRNFLIFPRGAAYIQSEEGITRWEVISRLKNLIGLPNNVHVPTLNFLPFHTYDSSITNNFQQPVGHPPVRSCRLFSVKRGNHQSYILLVPT